MGHRMSSLPIAKYCGRSPVLGAEGGCGRPAIMGRAFHSSCDGSPDASALLQQLTDEECEELAGWHRPSPVEVGGVTLTYEEATRESEVALDCEGNFTTDVENALTVGHLDFAWVVDVDGKRIAYVADIKRSEWTVSDGTDSLQLQCYGLAWATLHDCDAFAVGIWAATEGTWSWSGLYDMFDDGPEIWEAVSAAAVTPDEAVTGTHCTGCWSRNRCSEHLLPAAAVASEPGSTLAQFAEGGAGIQTQGDARKALSLVKALETMLEVTKGATQDWARRNGGIVSDDGKKRYLPVMTKGRSKLDKKSLEAAHPGICQEHEKRGAPFPVFRWINNK